MKKISKPLWYEKALGLLVPNYAAKIYHTRLHFEAAAYIAGSSSRRATSSWVVSKGQDADSEIAAEIDVIRDRSRDLVRNNPLAIGSIKTKTTAVIGGGLVFQSRVQGEILGLSQEQAEELNDIIEMEFNAYFNSANCDYERSLSFGRIQALAFKSMLENGDVFAVLPYLKRPGDVYGLKIQLLEADRINNKDRAPNSESLYNGIELNKTTGEPIAYHISSSHPNDYSKATTWSVLPAYGANSGRRNILHLFIKNRIGQHRGLPDLTPVVELFKQLGNYTDAEVMAAVVSSMFTAFIETDNPDVSSLSPTAPTTETGGKTSDADYKLGVGAILDLAPGEKVTFADPSRPNTSFDNFVQSILRQIGVGLELPFEMLIKHFNASYSASRAAMVIAYQYFETSRKIFVEDFCMPIYQEWFIEAALSGRIPVINFNDPVRRKAYLNSEWCGPAMPQIDEGKEVDASIKRMENNLSTLSDEIAKHGGKDWEGVVKQRAKEKNLIKELIPVTELKSKELPTNEQE